MKTRLAGLVVATLVAGLAAPPADGQVVRRVVYPGMTVGDPAVLNDPTEPAVDSAGNVWVAGTSSDNVFRVAPDGTATLVLDGAGAGGRPLVTPTALIVDGQDRVWVAGTGNHTLFRIDTDGSAHLVLDEHGVDGEPLRAPAVLVEDSKGRVLVGAVGSDNVFRIDGPAATPVLTAAGAEGRAFADPRLMAADPMGRVYVTSRDLDVFRIDDAGVVRALSTEDGPGVIVDLDVDPVGDVYVTHYLHWTYLPNEGTKAVRISRLAPASGPLGPQDVIDWMFASPAGGMEPESVAIDAQGQLYVAGRYRTFVPDPYGGFTNFTIQPKVLKLGLGGLAQPQWTEPGSLAVDGAGDVFWRAGPGLQAGRVVHRASFPGPVSELPGSDTGRVRFRLHDDGTVWTAHARNGSDGGADTVKRVAPDGTVTLLLDRAGTSGAAPVVHEISRPVGVGVDRAGNVYVGSRDTGAVVRITPDGAVSTVLSLPPSATAQNRLIDVVPHPQDGVFVVARTTQEVHRVDGAGAASLVFGPGLTGGVPLQWALDATVDPQGVLYVGDALRVFRVPPAGPVTVAFEASPTLSGKLAVAAAPDGSVYVAGETSVPVLRLLPGGGAQTVSPPSGIGGVVDLAVAPDGSLLVQNGIGLHRLAGGVATLLHFGGASGAPLGVVVDDLGNATALWSRTLVRVALDGKVTTLLDREVPGLTTTVFASDGGLAVDALGTVHAANEYADEVLAVGAPDAWQDLGGASVGVSTAPRLAASGSLEPGTRMDRFLVGAAPDALCGAFVSFTSAPWDVLGGTLHAFPWTHVILFGTDSAGDDALSVTWPAGFASGTEITLQFVVRDGSVPAGLVLSNAVRQVVP